MDAQSDQYPARGRTGQEIEDRISGLIAREDVEPTRMGADRAALSEDGCVICAETHEHAQIAQSA